MKHSDNYRDNVVETFVPPRAPEESLRDVKISRQNLPRIMFIILGWKDKPVTRYISADKELVKVRADPDFSPIPGQVYQIGAWRLQEIGALGSAETGDLTRVVQVSEVESGQDLLGDLCEDTDGPFAEKASADLRERFDKARFEFKEFNLVGPSPRLVGNKTRREQIRLINYLSRSVAGADRALAKLMAQMLMDTIENIEPSGEL